MAEVASRVALAVLDGEVSSDGGVGGEWSAADRRLSEVGRLQAFWEYAGFPTPESRPWEVDPSSTVSSAGTSCASVCRSSVELSRSAPARVPVEPGPAAGEMHRGRSSSPPTGTGRFVGHRVRLGWRGPLPRPRVTPPPCLGDFLPASLTAALDDMCGAAAGVGVAGEGVAPVTAASAQAIQTQADVASGPVSTGDRGRRPWAHLRQRYRGALEVCSQPYPPVSYVGRVYVRVCDFFVRSCSVDALYSVWLVYSDTGPPLLHSGGGFTSPSYGGAAARRRRPCSGPSGSAAYAAGGGDL